MSTHPQTEVVLAAATGSTGGLGKITTIPATSGTLIVRCDNTGFGRSQQVDWRVKSDQAYSVQLYRARSVVNAATITLGTAALDDGDGFTLNGLVYTAEATAATADFASRKYSVAGNTAAQCTELAKLINADYSVVTAGTSVAGTDKLVITTDEGAHTIVAAAAADYPAGKYALNVTAATELASIVLAINHKATVTCASVAAGDYVEVGGIVYTAKAGAENTTTHYFSKDTSNDATGTSLAACVNADTATHGISAVNTSGAVAFTRASAAVHVRLASSNATRLACVVAGGVPGVIASATGATGELCITPTWTAALTVTEAGDQLTVTDIDSPGLYAVAGATTVTLSCTTPGNPTGGDKATTIQFVLAGGAQAADANEATFASTTLTYLTLDGAAYTGVAANSTTSNGALYTQWIDGWDQGYMLISNGSGSAQTVTVAATKY